MFKIGEFSRLAQVSARMLRYYDQCGLLHPDRVDHFTGYRLYSAAQLTDLARIVALRDMGFGAAALFWRHGGHGRRTAKKGAGGAGDDRRRTDKAGADRRLLRRARKGAQRYDL